MVRAPRLAVARARMRRARPDADAGHHVARPRAAAARHDHGNAGGVELVAPRPGGGSAGGIRAAGLPARHRRDRRRHVAAGQHGLPPAHPPRRAMGLRLRAPRCPHAGHGGRFRTADSPHLSAVLRHEARIADAIRSAAEVSRRDRRSHLAHCLPAPGPRCAARRRGTGVAAAGSHRHLPALQLRDSAGVAGIRAVTMLNWLTQILEVLAALLAAPLFIGWVNQCRAWLQNKSAPSALLPYRNLRKLFHKEAVLANNASPFFRLAPYVVFGAMVCAAAIIPTLGTRLPFSNAADAIALVGLFATARVFMSLAAFDVGTAFGTLGARREMLVGFLAEPALLMVIFLASLISTSTALPTISEGLATRALGLYPSLAFTGVAFALVLLAENARIPVDNPATHLELTMIHEAMLLEYSARHLALMEWAAALKLFNYACIGFALFLPWGVATGEAGPLALLLSIPLLAVKLALAGLGIALIETLSAKLRVF